ncbi:SLAM family member 6 isoform X2 [Leopardus geoffroyi]|uniref:SLAM family member 6 isoform X2 n=1 Tax=Leopardus geoffroyi TaxID=46844 RepID=UPI001E26406E|nr:SLAM family member 6 isoform X2 [Leopardus geoffroyi]
MTEAPRVDTGRRRPPAPVCPAVMLWLLLPLALVSCLGPGHTASQASSTPLMVNGTLGESVTFPLKLPISEDTLSITWLYNGTSITFIQLSDPSDPQIILTNPKWKDRLQFTRNYSLQLSNLTMADAGSYHAQITTQTSTVFSSYRLRIFRPLRNLEVANHTWRSENGTCEIHLTCSVENTNDNNLVRWEVAGSISIREANLTLSWDPKKSSEEKYTCIAENPVSQLSFSVSTQSLCKDFLNDKSIGTLWIAPVTIILICPVIVLLVVCRKKCCLCKRAENTNNLEYVSISSGNTVYARVTHPKRQTSNPTPMKSTDSSTIYSAVHQSKESKPISPRTTALGDVNQVAEGSQQECRKDMASPDPLGENKHSVVSAWRT